MSGKCTLGPFGWTHTMADPWCQCKNEAMKSKLKEASVELESEVKRLRTALEIIARNYTEDVPSSFVLLAKQALAPQEKL